MIKFDPPPLFQARVEKKFRPPTSSLNPPPKEKFRPPHLLLDNSNTEFIWFGTPQQLSKLDLPLLIERFPSFTFHSSVRNLGVVLDSTLTFSEHVANLTRSSYFHLRR